MMQPGIPPFSTRVLAVAAIASILALGWTLLGPRAAPAPVVTADATAFPLYPATPALERHAVNAADPAWAQPLFFRDRKPRAVSLGESGDAGGNAASSFDATLTGIIRSATLNAASLQRPGQPQPVRVRLGQAVPDAAGWRLVELTAKTARFQSGSDEKILKMEVQRPDGSAPPPAPIGPATPMSAAPRNDAPAAGDDAARNANSNATPVPPEHPPAQSSPAPNQQQQIEAVRQRIEAARKAQRQPAPTVTH